MIPITKNQLNHNELKQPVNIAVVDQDIKVASLFLQKINGVDGFVCTQIHQTLNDFSSATVLPKILLVSFDQFKEKLSRVWSWAVGNSVYLMLYAKDFQIEEVLENMKFGAAGFFDQRDFEKIMEESLIRLRDYGAYLSPRLTKKLFDHNCKPVTFSSNITIREIEICKLLFQGFTYEQIAQKCAISINTVRFHVRTLYKKNNVNSKIKLFKCLQLT